ncbi:MAG TPA: crossover junction endodeoxyribonuclease RuvC [Chloroflexota bacterium]|nr:crossover junction endodeoxyribonuclease RuvC [Chloroflexota bacterium]
MRVLGVDPGLVRTGWALATNSPLGPELVDAGLIAPDPEAPFEARLAEGFAAFVEVLQAQRPNLVVLEDIYTAPAHPKSALLMAHMRGVLCLAVQQQGVALRSLTASTVKQRITGNGRASKEQVRGMVFRLCRMPPQPLRADVTDALALAIAGLSQEARGARAALAPRRRPNAALARLLREARG